MEKFKIIFKNVKGAIEGVKGTLIVEFEGLTLKTTKNGEERKIGISDFSAFRVEMVKQGIFFFSKTKAIFWIGDKMYPYILLDKDKGNYQKATEEVNNKVLEYQKERFETLKIEKTAELLRLFEKQSSQIQQSFAETAANISACKFDENKKFSANLQSIEAAFAVASGRLDFLIKTDAREKRYDATKQLLLNSFVSSKTESPAIQSLFEQARAELESMKFDSSISDKENDARLASVEEKFKKAIFSKRKEERIEREAKIFESYKAQKITSFRLDGSNSEEVNAIVDKELKSINGVSFDPQVSIETNKKVIDVKFEELLSNIKKQQLKEQLYKNTKAFLEAWGKMKETFIKTFSNTLGSARTAYLAGLKKLNSLKFNEKKDLEENLKLLHAKVDNCTKEIVDSQESDQKELEKLKGAPENFEENSSLIKARSKNIYAPILQNPYFVLGISCDSTNSQAMNVRDKVEKYTKLKITKSLTTEFDLKNIERPTRDLSSVQTAIVSLSDTSNKYLWFTGNQYCKIWESHLIIDWLASSECDFDLILAAYIHLLVKDAGFELTKEWTTFFAKINAVFSLSHENLYKELVDARKCSDNESPKDVADAFKQTFLKPLMNDLEYSSSYELSNFIKAYDGFEKACPSFQENVAEVLIRKAKAEQATNDQFFDKKGVEKTTIKEEIPQIKDRITIIKNIKDFVLSKFERGSAFNERVCDCYQQSVINAIIFLKDNGESKTALALGKQLYKVTDPDTKRRLRYTFGYDKVGASESELSAEEMHDIGAKYLNGVGVRKNEYMAFTWYKKAADKGYIKSIFALGVCYLQGVGCTANSSLGRRYLLEAAAAGDADALEVLKSLGVPHEHYDLGYVYVSSYETKIVEVQILGEGYVRLMDDYNFNKYSKSLGEYIYYGGFHLSGYVRIKIPSSDHWHCVIDNDGSELDGLTSLSCRIKTL